MVFDTTIVGTKFRGNNAMETLKGLRKGDRLRLQREPSNQFDPNAIAVLADGEHLGYVPKTDNVKLIEAFKGERPRDLIVELTAEAIIDRNNNVRFSPKIRIRKNDRSSTSPYRA